MQSKKLLTIALALSFVATFAFAFAFAAEGSDAADIEKSKEADWSKFTDTSKGHFYVYLDNNTDNEMVVKVTVYDGKSGDELDNTVATIPATTTAYEIRMTFGFGSDGTKLVNYKVTNEEGTVTYFSEGNFEISVSHSIWKNTSTYVLLVAVIIAIVVIAYFVMRARATKQKSTGGTKTFTQLEAERKAKKAGKVAEKQNYSASGSKKKRN